ncbi:MAG: hypothetical protein R3B93_05205 [Bacteroidia bacterium]
MDTPRIDYPSDSSCRDIKIVNTINVIPTPGRSFVIQEATLDGKN